MARSPGHESSIAGLTGAEVLAGAFRNTTNSYKHLFFRALLKRVLSGEQAISFLDLAPTMLEEAWWPAFHYRLNLGASDQVCARIERATDATELRRNPAMVRAALRAATRGARDPLLRYVPARFLRPWFATELKGIADAKVDKLIGQMSLDDSRAGLAASLYILEDQRVVIRDEWMRFLTEHMAFVSGWSDANWLAYLEARNPGVPGLMSKISPDLDRASLHGVTQLWKTVMQKAPVHCIYTGQLLTEGDLVMDHCLPRSFIAHDRLYNLTPTSAAVNRNKSDAVPTRGHLERMAFQHAEMAKIAAATPTGGTWAKFEAEAAADLRVSPETLRDSVQLSSVYAEHLGSMASIAVRMGFPAEWRLT